MRSVLIVALLGCIDLTGCNHKQQRISELEQQYIQAHKQYVDDCVSPQYGAAGADSYFKGTKAKTPTPRQEKAQQEKCQREAQRADELQQQLQAASQ